MESVNKSMKKGFEKRKIDEIFKEYAITDELDGKTKDSITFMELVQKVSDLDELRADKVQKNYI